MSTIPLVDLHAQYLSMKGELDEALSRVIGESAFIGTAGNHFVSEFERDFASYAGLDHCVACGNGTDALEILLRVAGIGPGDEVLVPALSWIATSEAVSTCGATPVFVDVLPGLYTIDPDAAAAKISSRTRAIIPVHLYGLPARMDEICRLADRYRLFVLEDCAQAHGARYRGRPVGTYGHAASFSFFPGKNLGAWGDAGAMLTNDSRIASTSRMIAHHGQTARKHDHQMEGRNSRMDGIHAAVLSAKLKRLDQWTILRRGIAERYRDAISELPLSVQERQPDAESVYHLFVIEAPDRDSLRSHIEARGVATAVQYPQPLPLLPAYSRFGHRQADFPVASSVTSRIFSVPLYPEMTPAQEAVVLSSLQSAVEARPCSRP
jgi:dTDP-4-amino-4,6-dideoxygalactose transaminase